MFIWALVISLQGWGAIIDQSPPQDILGHWEFDLYDASGLQRGTSTNPIYTQSTTPPTFLSRTLIGNGTTTIKTGTGTIHGFVINNNSTGGVIYLYDSTTGSGTIATTGNAGTPSGGLLSGSGNPGANFVGPLDIQVTNGITAVVSGSTQNSFTVIYK
jgi:hypothetical protein